MIPSRSRRRGWSLLELMVVITGATGLLTIAAGLIFQMLKVGQSERSGFVAASGLDRLAHDLRADARGATGPADLGLLRLVLPLSEGRTVEYVLGKREAIRTLRRGDKPEHREQYRWPSGMVGRFEASRDPIALVLDPDPEAGPAKLSEAPFQSYRIEAVPGRDVRLGGGGGR